jgi:hypothetical protein
VPSPPCGPLSRSALDVPVLILNGKSDAANQKVARLIGEIPTARFKACEGDHHSTPYQPTFHRAVVALFQEQWRRRITKTNSVEVARSKMETNHFGRSPSVMRSHRRQMSPKLAPACYLSWLGRTSFHVRCSTCRRANTLWPVARRDIVDSAPPAAPPIEPAFRAPHDCSQRRLLFSAIQR